MTQHFSTVWASLLSGMLIIGLMADLNNIFKPTIGLAVVVGGLMLAIFSHNLAKLFERLSQRQFRFLLSSLLIIMVIIQCLILKNLPLTIYHDPFRVLDQAVLLAHHHYQWQTTYFWRYPNNVCLTYFLSRWLILTNWLGLSVNLSVNILELVTLDALAVVILITVYHLSRQRSAVILTLLYMMATPFAYTYYLTVFYSDTVVMLMMMLIILILSWWSQLKRTQQFIAGGLLIILGSCGVLAKESLVVIIPALLLTAVTCLSQRQKLIKLGPAMMAILVGVMLSLPLQAMIYHSANFHRNYNYQFPVTAWVSMGLNTESRGTYSNADVAELVKVKHYHLRKQVANHRLHQRIHQLGIMGVAKQMIIKIGILLNGANIAQWYNGGARAAPPWYQFRLTTILKAIAVTYQIAMATVFWLVIGRVLGWQSFGSANHFLITNLTVLLALGFLTFYACFWEAEERYGQIVLPLLLVFLASSENNIADTWRTYVSHSVAIAVMSIIAFVGGATTPLSGSAQTNTLANARIVAAQRSQLSTNYRAHPDQIKPGKIISQEIILHRSANRVSVQTYPHAHTNGELISLSTNRHYRLIQSGTENLIGYYHLPVGKYRLEITNHTHTDQPQAIVHVSGYQLAPYPLRINGQQISDASLIYKITTK